MTCSRCTRPTRAASTCSCIRWVGRRRCVFVPFVLVWLTASGEHRKPNVFSHLVGWLVFPLSSGHAGVWPVGSCRSGSQRPRPPPRRPVADLWEHRRCFPVHGGGLHRGTDSAAGYAAGSPALRRTPCTVQRAAGHALSFQPGQVSVGWLPMRCMYCVEPLQWPARS